MLHRVVIAIGMIGALAITSARAQEAAGPRPQTFRTAVDLVTIQASVRDARGRIVTGLKATDFEVRDNGQLRPILSLRSDQSPLSLAILVDLSGSMRLGPKMAMAHQAYESVLSQLRSGQDEVALFTFDAALHERCDFTHDLDALKKNWLDDFEPFGTTSLYDATAEAAQRLAARAGTRKAIIVLTDGIDTSSAMNARDVSGVASSIDVPVFVIATMPSLDQRVMLETAARPPSADAADLRDLAHWTGGQFVFASTFVETVAAAGRLIDDLRQQYVLAIETAEVREWRRLDVRVKRPSTKVKARTGYFAG